MPYMPSLSRTDFFTNQAVFHLDRGAKFFKQVLVDDNESGTSVLVIETYIVPYGSRSQRVFFRFLTPEEERSPILEQFEELTEDDFNDIEHIIKSMFLEVLRGRKIPSGTYTLPVDLEMEGEDHTSLGMMYAIEELMDIKMTELIHGALGELGRPLSQDSVGDITLELIEVLAEMGLHVHPYDVFEKFKKILGHYLKPNI
jgi:hypothetical protein